ncbi:MAG: hypothetical protein U0893_13840 [Chloroflexota bacterium]
MVQIAPDTAKTSRAWLQVAEQVKDEAGATEVFRHAPLPDASVERLRELAGIVKLNGPLPSREFLDADGDRA